MSRPFTTGEVAKICKVAPGTVLKWFESGRISGYRIPSGVNGKGHRRITRESVETFLEQHQMPVELLAEFEAAITKGNES